MAASESKQRGGTPREPTNQVNTGIVNPMLGFLDRNLSRFSQPVRDTIGIGILLTLVVFVLNGLLGPTYIRGQLWMDGEPAAGFKVLHGDDNTITNENGYWTLPLSGNGIPGRIRIDIEGPDRAPDGKTSQRRTTMGDFYALGPWPVWNILRPMNDYVYDIDPSQPKGKWVKPRFAELPSFFRGVKLSVYAQSKETSQQSPRTQRLPSGTSCALSLNEVKVGELSGWFRSSGRAYFEMYLDDKLVDGSTLLYGPGIGSKAGTFPVRSDKELWLPIRTGSDDHYKARLADLTGVAECSIDQVGKVQIHAKGDVKLKMFTDQGETLNSFDLNTAFDSPNQEIVLTGDPRQRSSITVEAIADETKQRSLTPITAKDIGEPAIRLNTLLHDRGKLRDSRGENFTAEIRISSCFMNVITLGKAKPDLWPCGPQAYGTRRGSQPVDAVDLRDVPAVESDFDKRTGTFTVALPGKEYWMCQYDRAKFVFPDAESAKEAVRIINDAVSLCRSVPPITGR